MKLTVAFALVAALAATAIAIGAYLLARQAWLAESLGRSGADTRYQLLLAEQFLPLDAQRADGLLDSFARSDRTVILVIADDPRPSHPLLNPDLPEQLRARVAGGELAYHRLATDDQRLLVVGGQIGGTPTELYVVYSEEPIHADLAQLQTMLLLGVVAIVALAAAVGFGLDTRWRTLAQARERERRFTADVAHELRTPVTALVAAASLLRDQRDLLPAEARRPVELVVTDVDRLRRLLSDLLEVARLDSGEEAVRPEPVELAALIQTVAAGWRDQVQVEAPATKVRTDPRRLERVLSNLVANAIEHGGDGVTVRLSRAGPVLRVAVSDRGPGIEPEHLPHLFDRFYQADPARAGAGSGLGLAIARENARLLGGDIQVHSAPGGTEFLFTLPVTLLLPDGEAPVGQGADGGPRRGTP